MKVHSRPTSFSQSPAGQPPLQRRGPVEPHPFYVLLFGQQPPRRLDRRRYPALKKGMKKLEMMRDQIADILGVPSETYTLHLAEGANATVSHEGDISIGIELLEEHQEDDALMLAVLAHEMGHQPWTWPTHEVSHLSKGQRDALSRAEEAKADRFAGKALAELGIAPDAICEFLVSVEKFEPHPPADYYPAPARAQMIREAFRRRKRALKDAGQFNPAAAQRARELR